MLKVVHDQAGSNDSGLAAGESLLDEIVRDGAGRMLAAALAAEVAAYIDAHADQLDEQGHRLVVRNGYQKPREVTTAAGVVAVRAPRVNDKRIDEATRRAEAVRLVDSAGVVAQVTAGGRGAAAALPPRAVRIGLRCGVGAVPRRQRRAVRVDYHPTHRAMAKPREMLRQTVAGRRRLRQGLMKMTPSHETTTVWNSSHVQIVQLNLGVVNLAIW